MSKKTTDIDVVRIMEMIPHRYPFLMIDRMIDIVPDVSAVSIKNVSINEQFFQGHFPDKPVVPGVLLIEMMAQTAAADDLAISLVVGNMGDWRSQFPILSSTPQSLPT